MSGTTRVSRSLDWTGFERAFERIFEVSALLPGALHVDVIVNPNAGRFSSEARAERTLREFVALTPAGGTPRASGPVHLTFHHTRYVGHAREIVLALPPLPTGARRLLVSAGGDGTHGEVLSGYLESDLADKEHRIVLMRLPLGTGNDGADARGLDEAVAMLRGDAQVQAAGYLVVKPAGMGTFHGFNIASIGLDAYVAEVTNRLKQRFQGDLYKVVADVATLFYEQIVGVGPMGLAIVDAEGTSETMVDNFMLVALGVSGNRWYGGGKLVLPGAENLCAISRIGLVGKIRLKGLFYRGAHVDEPNVTMRSFDRVTVNYARRIPLQVDGESVWLEPHNFPLDVTRVGPVIPVLAHREPDGPNQSNA